MNSEKAVAEGAPVDSGYDVTVFLDESTVEVCATHDTCPKKGALGADDCSMLYLHGVGASVFETHDDRTHVLNKLGAIKSSIAVRGGVSSSKRMGKFVAGGWHATEDLPEFADPLILEVDLNSVHKGHVRYIVSDRKLDTSLVYHDLFIRVLRPIITRYSQATTIEITFERSDDMRDAECRSIVDAAGGSGIKVSRQPKGSDLLAIADYLLFASMRYAGRNEQLCARGGCKTKHKMPIGATVRFNSEAKLLPEGHVGVEDRWHKLYFSFVRGMSSFVGSRDFA
ncbi:hypothetical protein [Microbacterium oxydans]|uniref:hypothetical protein n=1 Tax=Microbacterium oxydans TaxID=82380 RepID=UPI001E3EFDB9|nr:hypothetical protein [Microbacterium oxydans]